MPAAAEAGFPPSTAQANLNVAWIHGSEAAKYNTDPDIQVHAYNEHTYIPAPITRPGGATSRTNRTSN
jgi:hypothetical protein